MALAVFSVHQARPDRAVTRDFRGLPVRQDRQEVLEQPEHLVSLGHRDCRGPRASRDLGVLPERLGQSVLLVRRE